MRYRVWDTLKGEPVSRAIYASAKEANKARERRVNAEAKRTGHGTEAEEAYLFQRLYAQYTVKPV